MKRVLTPKEFADKMRVIAADGDKEVAHAKADDLICETLILLGYDEGAGIFLGMEKWYA